MILIKCFCVLLQNILSVERKVREISRQRKVKLIVYTGLSKILYKNGKNLYIQMLTRNNKIEVPLVYWKFVINTRSNATVVFTVLLNNTPTLRDIQNFENICECQCERYEFKFENKNDPCQGLIRCCRLRDLLKKVGYKSLVTEIESLDNIISKRLAQNLAKSQKAEQSSSGRAWQSRASNGPGVGSRPSKSLKRKDPGDSNECPTKKIWQRFP